MKKMIILMSACLMISTVDAQQEKTGINTDAPTEALDVNGKLRVRDLPNKQDTHTQVYADSDGVLHRAPLPKLKIEWPRDPIINPFDWRPKKPKNRNVVDALKCSHIMSFLGEDFDDNINIYYRALSKEKLLATNFFTRPSIGSNDPGDPRYPYMCFQLSRCHTDYSIGTGSSEGLNFSEHCTRMGGGALPAGGTWTRPETEQDLKVTEILLENKIITSPDEHFVRQNRCNDYRPFHKCTADGIGFKNGAASGSLNIKTGHQIPLSNDPEVDTQANINTILDLKGNGLGNDAYFY